MEDLILSIAKTDSVFNHVIKLIEKDNLFMFLLNYDKTN